MQLTLSRTSDNKEASEWDNTTFSSQHCGCIQLLIHVSEATSCSTFWFSVWMKIQQFYSDCCRNPSTFAQYQLCQTYNQSKRLYCISHFKFQTSLIDTCPGSICFFNLFLNVIKWVGCIFKGFILWILLQLVAFECQEYTSNIQEITSVCRSYPWGSHYWNLSLSYPFPFPSTFPIVFQPV